MGGGLAQGGGTVQIHATWWWWWQRRFEALAAAEESARSAPGTGGVAGGGGVRWQGWRRHGHGGGGEEPVGAARDLTMVGRPRRVPSELVNGKKVREFGEMATGMEGQ
uniref:DUF834 domain-containing protein n=1 Tax=Oryza rufipogon TaxID=4529 RepID=A0A0E0P4V7_ORYRU